MESIHQNTDAPASATFLNLPEEKQQRVYQAALDEFSAHGFGSASSNRIARALGIAKGSLFQYFGNKERLFHYVFDRVAGQFAEPLRSVRDATRDEPLGQRIREALLTVSAFLEAHPEVYRLYTRMLFQESFPLRETLLSRVRSLSTKYWRSLVEDAKARGELRPDVDMEAAVFFLDALMDRFFQARTLPYMDTGFGLHDDARLDACIDALVSCIERGLIAPC
ncbi:TetR/AcrR family transcriptional regulator [Oceanidesulfovibrio marinus]|uniref:TetR/AcrR family transcriptional regulator n=1 Tax=Oceanidesulfovibrio marinus TaxID=370038 RepID=A0A6P1ZLA8_9BACT|nr:TetR/AcrR family transcriptional regulator [Oceanidesulfovibrio marinus]QJT09993.1 TetR/AcrR family transcriptional regulator [Oceanidesulfovibrio marinus]TVM35889.1 TetR/AcrR family transcriptional regulator [Oceanidesulfovibrio marinus]